MNWHAWRDRDDAARHSFPDTHLENATRYLESAGAHYGVSSSAAATTRRATQIVRFGVEAQIVRFDAT